MGHEPHLDHPGEVTWWVGHGPAPILGDCPHLTCQHRDTSTVAWGPDWEHYELVNCIEKGDGACAGACRGWHGVTEVLVGKAPAWRHYWHGFRAFDATREHCTTRAEAHAAEARIAADRAAERSTR